VITPEQNGHIESFRKTLKKERAWPEAFEIFGKACVAIAKAGEDYNEDRIHPAPKCLTPNELAGSLGEQGA